LLSKKKLHFYQLCFISICVVIVTLLINWGYFKAEEKSKSMMTNSMGGMMSSMHLKNIKLSDLFIAENENKDSTSSNINSNKSNEMAISYKKEIHYVSTIIIIVLLPFIIAGTVFLTIVWIK
jgi:t-SNARE complex subunit (syntaxin)